MTVPPRAARAARIEYAAGFLPAFKELNKNFARMPHPTRPGKETTELALALETFIQKKERRPPENLLAAFKDHMLKGRLAEYRECHLAGDVLLIYVDRDDTG